MKLKLSKSSDTKVWTVYNCDKASSVAAYIKFENNKFNEVKFFMSGKYSRDDWRILSEIEKMITKIEKEIKCTTITATHMKLRCK